MNKLRNVYSTQVDKCKMCKRECVQTDTMLKISLNIENLNSQNIKYNNFNICDKLYHEQLNL